MEQVTLFLHVLRVVLHVPLEFFRLLSLLPIEQLRRLLLQLRLLQLVQKAAAEIDPLHSLTITFTRHLR